MLGAFAKITELIGVLTPTHSLYFSFNCLLLIAIFFKVQLMMLLRHPTLNSKPQNVYICMIKFMVFWGAATFKDYS